MTTLTAVTEMDARQLEIFGFCETYFFDHENPTLVSKNARFHTEGYDAFGLDEAQLKKLRDEIFTRFQPTIPELAHLAPHFFATGKYEFGTIALLLLKKHRPRFTRDVYEEIKNCLDKGVENLEHADLISAKISPIFLELNLATMEDFATWLISPSKWTRRVVALTMLYQKSILPVQELLDFILPLMRDQEKLVQQAVGQLLSELWKLYPAELEEFLTVNKDTAPRLLMDTAIEKMPKELKRRFFRPQPEHKRPFKPNYRKSRPRQEKKHA